MFSYIWNMINGITRYEKSSNQEFYFSVLIPTWNNLAFLKNCLASIEKNSSLHIQPIIIANEAKDGTLEWLKEQEYDFVHAKENIGVCYALNSCRSLIKSDYVLYLNDDMYVLPGWDIGFKEEIEQTKGKDFMFSGTMIEPTETGNPCVIVKNYGDSLETFKEEELLKEFASLPKENWNGSTWPPNVVHIDVWDIVGGLSIEFSPGMYSDPDFSRKLYEMGIRNFKGIANSRVYHFGSKSTRRVRKNLGRKRFIHKWGISANDFTFKFLQQGKDYSGEIKETELSFFERIKNWGKRVIN